MNRLQQFSMLALLVIATQGAWAQIGELTLYDAADNSTAISTALGNTYNVTLSGRTLYQDGDWNTLCLPFGMDATKIAASPLAGTTIKALDGDNSSLDANGKLTLQFTNATTIEAGKPYIVKWPVALIINNETDWDTFVGNVSAGITYAGKIVKLANDISIGSGDMVGTFTYNFMGVFDGGGHTITCNITDNSDQGAAPFFCIQNASIMNLKVTGSVTGGNHSAGLVGFALEGTNTIKNCEVNVDVTCSGAHCGGILGHGHSTTTTISDCLFSGSITGNGSTKVGVIYGWTNNSSIGTHTIKNCLANGTKYTSYGTIDMMQRDGTVATLTVTNCYQNIASTDKMGTYIDGYSASDLVSGLGSKWEVVGNKAVPKMTAESTITSPVFNGVTINNTTADVSFTGGTDTFKGNYDPLDIDDSNRSDILLLTSENQLGYAKADLTLNAFRAYFHIPAYPSPSAAVRVRSFALDFGDDEATGIISLSPDPSPKDKGNPYIYDLQGRKVANPTRGLYIVNGRKVLINK